MKAAKSLVCTTSAQIMSSAITVAERTLISSAARSPTSWPRPRMARTRSVPLSSMQILTLPPRITMTWSARPPSSMSLAPAANVRRDATALSASRSVGSRTSQKLSAGFFRWVSRGAACSWRCRRSGLSGGAFVLSGASVGTDRPTRFSSRGTEVSSGAPGPGLASSALADHGISSCSLKRRPQSVSLTGLPRSAGPGGAGSSGGLRKESSNSENLLGRSMSPPSPILAGGADVERA